MKKALIPIAAVVIVGIISAYALSPYFTESTIDEALPSGAVIQPVVEDDKMMMEDDKMMMEDDKMMMEDDKMMMEDDKMMMEDDKMMMEDDKMMMEDDKMMMEDDKMMMEKMVPVSYSGSFVGVGDGIHDAQGLTYTIPLENGENVLRLEDFKSTNGPDLYVYLSTDKHASDFVNLGELKANSGNQNYEIPNDVDLDKYNTVLIWCKAFGVLFGSAELSTT